MPSQNKTQCAVGADRKNKKVKEEKGSIKYQIKNNKNIQSSRNGYKKLGSFNHHAHKNHKDKNKKQLCRF